MEKKSGGQPRRSRRRDIIRILHVGQKHPGTSQFSEWFIVHTWHTHNNLL
jgi:hypothetical protein